MSRIEETEWIWKDGSFIRWADAQVHVLSHSMQFGSAAFEGVRCYHTPQGPAIFRLREHLTRLVNSVKIYRMDLSYSIDELIAASRELVVRNNVESCYIRPMVVRGYGAAGMVPFESPIEVYLPCWPWGAYLGAEALEKGVDACVSSWHRMAPNTVPALAKIAGNYLSGQLIKMEAHANELEKDLEDATERKINTRQDKLQAMRTKVEEYEQMMGGSLDSLRDRLERVQAGLAAAMLASQDAEQVA